MEIVTIEGTYANGHVALDEQPAGMEGVRVRVTFVTPDAEAELRRAELKKRFFARLERGVDFGTEPLPKREELYADRIGRF